MHTTVVPEIEAVGSGFTVMVVVVLLVQPLPSAAVVYFMVADPWATPNTTPVALTVAIPVFKLVHVPPAVALESGVELLTQTELLPVIPAMAGSGLTVIVKFDVVLVQPIAFLTMIVPVYVPAFVLAGTVMLIGLAVRVALFTAAKLLAGAASQERLYVVGEKVVAL